jgi:polysaccharide biosynthesis/export protein
MELVVPRKQILTLLVIILILSSCVPQKRLRYLQTKSTISATDTLAIPIDEYTLKPYDLLHVQLFSASPDLHKTPGFEVSTNLGTTASVYLQGYSVGPEGYLQLPLLGSHNVKGLTIREVQDLLTRIAREKISLDAEVVVKHVNFKISVLGEVKNPGVYEVFDQRISILDALAKSGDMTVYGDRQRVMLVRMASGGKQEVILLDLTDRAILQNPNFYLQSNDVIYVQPLDAKSYGFGSVQWSVIFSSISTLIAILAILYK